MTPDDARRTVEAGGRLVVMPHSDAEVIRAAKAAGAWCLPGVATPTEGFAALAAGADGLKLFPGEALPPAVVKAWKAVFPPTVPLLPVGGITPETDGRLRRGRRRRLRHRLGALQARRHAAEIAERAAAFARPGARSALTAHRIVGAMTCRAVASRSRRRVVRSASCKVL